MNLKEWLTGKSLNSGGKKYVCLSRVTEYSSCEVDRLLNKGFDEFWHVDVLEDGIAITWCFDK